MIHTQDAINYDRYYQALQQQNYYASLQQQAERQWLSIGNEANVEITIDKTLLLLEDLE